MDASEIQRRCNNILHEFKSKTTWTDHFPGMAALSNCGCCARCALRFTNQKSMPLFQERIEVLEAIIEEIKKIVSPPTAMSDTEPPVETHAEVGPASSSSSSSLPTTTSASRPVCTACFNILADAGSKSFTEPFLDRMSHSGYEFHDYTLTLQLPVSTIVRQCALWYHLRSLFPGNSLYKSENPEQHVVDIKEAVKWILGPLISRRLNYSFKNGSDFKANLVYLHAESSTEHEFIEAANEGWNKKRKTKKGTPRQSDSLANVSKALTLLPENLFCKYGVVPPQRVHALFTYNLTFNHESVYVAGRYNKYVRDLSQTPWLIDGELKSKDSVETLISQHIAPLFECDEARFSASGREDIDVRMLGSGRPFMLELINPHKIMFSREKYAEVEARINAHSDKIRVTRLQRIRKNQTNALKEGEETKRKTYKCCVWVDRPLTKADLDTLAQIKELEIDQKTPVRVLHRRSLATRRRTIYHITPEEVNGHFMFLTLSTQAGTYVKEFVHGDLGRTIPNVGTILGCKADILQLDVLEIEIDFPKQIDEPKPFSFSHSSSSSSSSSTSSSSSSSSTTQPSNMNIDSKPPSETAPS
eukprot:TRINITY_DN9580_c0_g1_i2.p1 TRINITY_DN9580_c0_g1~~TRINITY_DN9580_c0_g1_i2.p1  ORF type:complete len:587 (+),score=118.81 TRINITY_DN9580_c0_g1_i2:157-1917(+)